MKRHWSRVFDLISNMKKTVYKWSLWCALMGQVLFTASAWSAQPYQPTHPDPVLESWRWQAFPELKDLGLRCMTEATDGAIWFGTDQGVQRYDGLKWKTYTPENGLYGAPINVLCAAKDGRVYAGSDRGISRFDGETWQRVFPPQGDLSWPIDQIIETSDGSIWAATAWGGLKLGVVPTIYTTGAMADVLRVQAPYVQISVIPDSVIPKRTFVEGTGIKVTKGGYLGIARGEEAMVVWALSPDGPGIKAGLEVGDHIVKMGNVMLQLPHLTLDGPGASVVLDVVRPGREDSFKVTVDRSKVMGQYSGFSISTVHEDHDGRMWFGMSWGGEIVRRDRDGQWYLIADSLRSGDRPVITQAQNGVQNGTLIHTSILATREGTLWIGGHNGLLYAFRNGIWTVCTPAEVPISQTRIIGLLEASDGALWIAGLGQEATRLDYGTARWITYAGLEYQCEGLDGSLWFIATKGRRIARKHPVGLWIVVISITDHITKGRGSAKTRCKMLILEQVMGVDG